MNTGLEKVWLERLDIQSHNISCIFCCIYVETKQTLVKRCMHYDFDCVYLTSNSCKKNWKYLYEWRKVNKKLNIVI